MLTLRTWFSVAFWEGVEENERMGVAKVDGLRKVDWIMDVAGDICARRNEGIRR